jgi:hypothetical protein
MGAVLGQNGNARTGLEIAALQMCRHAARLIQHLAPGVFDHPATADRLYEDHLVRMRGLVVVNIVQNQFGIVHVVPPPGHEDCMTKYCEFQFQRRGEGPDSSRLELRWGTPVMAAISWQPTCKSKALLVLRLQPSRPVLSIEGTSVLGE